MAKGLRIVTIFLVIVAIAYIIWTFNYKDHHMSSFFIPKGLVVNILPKLAEKKTSNSFSINTILKEGNGILFVETTDRMTVSSLVLCAIESAARVYPDRPVVFFMRGLKDIITGEDEKRARQHFPTLSSFGNVYLVPLRMDQLLNKTPLKPWFDKVNPQKEVYWTHVSADACRLALIWKYGGIYLDTDIISFRPVTKSHFLATESLFITSNSVFGLSSHYQLVWQFMENFVENYRGELWGHQGPLLFTRVVKKLCGLPVFKNNDDLMCSNIPYFHYQRFYPGFSTWEEYYEVWKNLSTFDKAYGLHLWNFLNKEGKTMVPGSNTLVEHLYKKYCPTTYGYILEKKKIHL